MASDELLYALRFTYTFLAVLSAAAGSLVLALGSRYGDEGEWRFGAKLLVLAPVWPLMPFVAFGLKRLFRTTGRMIAAVFRR